MALTIVVEVVCSVAEDLERAGKVKHVELVVEGKEHVDGLLVSHGGGLVCSHLDGFGVAREGVLFVLGVSDVHEVVAVVVSQWLADVGAFVTTTEDELAFR